MVALTAVEWSAVAASPPGPTTLAIIQLVVGSPNLRREPVTSRRRSAATVLPVLRSHRVIDARIRGPAPTPGAPMA